MADARDTYRDTAGNLCRITKVRRPRIGADGSVTVVEEEQGEIVQHAPPPSRETVAGMDHDAMRALLADPVALTAHLAQLQASPKGGPLPTETAHVAGEE